MSGEGGSLFTGAAVLDAKLTVLAERARWARMLRIEADAVACTSTDWSPEEVEQVLRELADKIERGGAR